jgi:penicillin-binding protein 1C
MGLQKRFLHPLKLLGAGGILFLASPATLHYLLPDYRDALKQQRSRAALVVVDSDDRLLRLVPDERDRFSFWCDIGRIPRSLKLAVIAAEDRRFYYRPGFDPISVLRAAFTNLHRRKIVSEASTVTQQVVRLIRPRPGTYKAKLLELLESLKMECQLSKEQILELYFNLSPMGGNVRGVCLAARLYFGKDVERISTVEAAILAAIPRFPSRYDFRNSAGRPRK